MSEQKMRTECAWCQVLISDGCMPVSHGCCPACAEALLIDDTWKLPEMNGDARWMDAYIATQLQDVLARRFFNTPFPKLTTADRADIRLRTEAFVAQMSILFAERPVLVHSRPGADLNFDGLTEDQLNEIEARR